MQPSTDGFEPVTGPAIETAQAAPLVVVAYGAIWLAVLFYLWLLHRRQTRLQADIDELARRAGDK